MNDSSDDQRSSVDGRTTAKRSWVLPALSIVMFVVVVVGIAVMGSGTDRPRTGDCIGSVESDLFNQMSVLDCASPDARYTVVAHADSGLASQVRESICDGHPDGEAHIKTVVKQQNKVEWAVCAVPL